MKQIQIADTTLCAEEGVFGFKEKLELARQLEKLEVDIIEFPEIQNAKTDSLLIRTACSFIKGSAVSVAVGSSEESLELAVLALSSCKRPRICLEVPVSAVGMEYIAKKKPAAMLQYVPELIQKAKESVAEVEFCAVDATRAEFDYLKELLLSAVSAGASQITICDSAAEMMPDDFAEFVEKIVKLVSVPVAVRCNNVNGLAAANSLLAIRRGATCVKVDINGKNARLEEIASMIKNCGNHYGIYSKVKQTELHRIVKQMLWISANAKNEKSAMTVATPDDSSFYLDATSDQSAVSAAVLKIGYDLSEEDLKKVYDEFIRVASKKSVGIKELDAIVASVALQVPATYQLMQYVINNGNIISSSAQITLSKGDEIMRGICLGDGPVDAAFRAIDQIIGHHYELDDFQIQSVTEGKEAMGSALVKLRSAGKLYSGNGISTDIIGASIRAYLNAVNKIVYEEE